MAKTTFAVIVGNRDFFPDSLVSSGRKDILKLFQEMDVEPVILKEDETKLGAVETWENAKQCAELFKKRRDRIDGILITLPNFGDEKGVADAIKLSGLNVPILVQAYPDDLNEMNLEQRRDSFCGKISVCGNLRQYGFPFTLTAQHTVHPLTVSFKADLQRFIGVCRVVKGMRSARIGAIGTRPNAFNTVRFSEKLLQEAGITVSTIDLSDILSKAGRIGDGEARVKEKIREISNYADANGVPQESLARMAKLAIVLLDWIEQNDLNATAIQCWTSLQENFGVVPCVLMSMMSERLMPSACEVDITGAAAMYALQLASGKPSALVDWNNNYGGDPNKCVLFHCGNWAKSFLPGAVISKSDILAGFLGDEKTYGAIQGRTPAGPLTFARISTDDSFATIRAYTGEGHFTDDSLSTFGSRAVVEIPELQSLLRYICQYGFEHHAAINASHTSEILTEAFDRYLNWDVYRHS
ncbi:MAG: L-fucose/L-arabinose isomerase family protein [Candidatus Omnitrophota bacterium]